MKIRPAFVPAFALVGAALAGCNVSLDLSPGESTSGEEGRVRLVYESTSCPTDCDVGFAMMTGTAETIGVQGGRPAGRAHALDRRPERAHGIAGRGALLLHRGDVRQRRERRLLGRSARRSLRRDARPQLLRRRPGGRPRRRHVHAPRRGRVGLRRDRAPRRGARVGLVLLHPRFEQLSRAPPKRARSRSPQGSSATSRWTLRRRRRARSRPAPGSTSRPRTPPSRPRSPCSTSRSDRPTRRSRAHRA